QKRKERERIISEAIALMNERLGAVGIIAEIQGRPKHFYSIYKKMLKSQKKDVSEIYDLSAIRIIVDSVKDCYGALGVVHTLWKPLPGRFKDFIAMPKSNGYQSLHTTVIGQSGQPLEIQIRTLEMHKISEYGIAAHWRYKEGTKGAYKGTDQKLAWLRQLLEWHRDLRDPREFIETVKMDVFADEVFVFTPRGDVIDLPAGSVPIDFAYRIHTDVGHHCVGAKVNGKMTALEYKLTNGDIVEIITSKHNNGPSRDWLNVVGSSETRNKIRQWFKKEKREANIAKGREMIERESKKLGYDWRDLVKDRLSEVAKKLSVVNEDDLFEALGYGGVSLPGVMTKLIEAHKKELKSTTPPDVSAMLAELKPRRPKSKVSHGILVKGESGLMVRLARCCNPLPGDTIIGYITRGRGVSVHRADCPNILNNHEEYERMIDVNWDMPGDTLYKVSVEITGGDRRNLLSDIMMVAAEAKINVSTLNARVQKNKTAVITMDIDISNLVQLEHIMNKMRRVKDVFSVHRMTQSLGGV
ncbi:MAG: RelA/SpoT family protein, partial [Sporomusa sp.]